MNTVLFVNATVGFSENLFLVKKALMSLISFFIIDIICLVCFFQTQSMTCNLICTLNSLFFFQGQVKSVNDNALI